MMAIINTSYEYIHEIEAAMELTNTFLSRLNDIPNEVKLSFVFENNASLNELRVRLEDYQTGVDNRDVARKAE